MRQYNQAIIDYIASGCQQQNKTNVNESKKTAAVHCAHGKSLPVYAINPLKLSELLSIRKFGLHDF